MHIRRPIQCRKLIHASHQKGVVASRLGTKRVPTFRAQVHAIPLGPSQVIALRTLLQGYGRFVDLYPGDVFCPYALSSAISAPPPTPITSASLGSSFNKYVRKARWSISCCWRPGHIRNVVRPEEHGEGVRILGDHLQIGGVGEGVPNTRSRFVSDDTSMRVIGVHCVASMLAGGRIRPGQSLVGLGLCADEVLIHEHQKNQAHCNRTQPPPRSENFGRTPGIPPARSRCTATQTRPRPAATATAKTPPPRRCCTPDRSRTAG